MHRSARLFPRALLVSASLLVLTVPGTRRWAGAFDSTVKPTGINTVWIFDPASPLSLQELTSASMAYIR